MTTKLSNIELIVLLKNYAKQEHIKIPNLQQKNKEELMKLCTAYKLLEQRDNNNVKINVENLSKKQMINDIEVFYLKQYKKIDNLRKMKKNELINIIEENDIPHITEDELKKQITEMNNYNNYVMIIKYNYIKYDLFSLKSIDFDNLTSNDLLKFIKDNKLDTNCDETSFNNISQLLSNLILSYKSYCNNMNIEYIIEKGTIPYILNKFYVMVNHKD